MRAEPSSSTAAASSCATGGRSTPSMTKRTSSSVTLLARLPRPSRSKASVTALPALMALISIDTVTGADRSSRPPLRLTSVPTVTRSDANVWPSSWIFSSASVPVIGAVPATLTSPSPSSSATSKASSGPSRFACRPMLRSVKFSASAPAGTTKVCIRPLMTCASSRSTAAPDSTVTSPTACQPKPGVALLATSNLPFAKSAGAALKLNNGATVVRPCAWSGALPESAADGAEKTISVNLRLAPTRACDAARLYAATRCVTVVVKAVRPAAAPRSRLSAGSSKAQLKTCSCAGFSTIRLSKSRMKVAAVSCGRLPAMP